MEDLAFLDLLECPVCLERLGVSAKVLPCQHTFCLPCLQKMVYGKAELRCPECRTPVTCEIEELPANLLLVRLLDGIRQGPGGMSKSNTVRRPEVFSSQDPSRKRPGDPRNSQALQHRHLQNTRSSLDGVPCARALYNYGGNLPGDLKFKAGDLIILRRQVDGIWYQGDIKGVSGLFPASFVQVINQLPQPPPLCRALYNFEMNEKDQDENKDCLTFRKDDIITLIRRVDENWAEGKLGDKVGIFPVLFSEPNSAALKILQKGKANGCRSISGNNSSTYLSGYRRIDTRRRSLKQPSMTSTLNRLNRRAQSPESERQAPEISAPVLIGSSNPALVAQFSERSREGSPGFSSQIPAAPVERGVALEPSPSPAVEPTNSKTITSDTNRSLSRQVSVSVCAALYPYTPRRAEELGLQKGEMVGVYGKHQEGWLRGLSLRTGKVGILPGNYVTPVLRTSATVSERKPALLTTSQTGRRSLIVKPQAAVIPLDRNSSNGTTRPAVQVHSVAMPTPVTSAGLVRAAAQPASTVGRGTGRSVFSTLHRGSSIPVNGTFRPSPSAMVRPQQPHPQPSTISPVATVIRQNHPVKTTLRRVSETTLPSTGSSATLNTRDAAVNGTLTKQITPQSILVKPDSYKNSSEKQVKTVRFQTQDSPPQLKRSNSQPSAQSTLKRREQTSTGVITQEPSSSQGTTVYHTRAGSCSVGKESKIPRPNQTTDSLDLSTPDMPVHIQQSSIKKQDLTEPPSTGRYKVLISCAAQREGELDLKEGDLVLVQRTRQDGWLQGIHEQTGKTGLLQYKFLEFLEKQS
ncbi:E3 ubiquitin-protein ligase SH3RF2-like isoform X2 [Acipenser oxyrinchus oxyrinchus]|uniref:E3 ubiquitin-protein ligase SH3RF1 n=1 Tax=Acipenser oxyrinchus oxyrinchus TaxID=40147 RepID=A0AAD8CX66_ACIOX|nr:E3 ubiquitin-protein ligase SH3RF2-like isoform X2 [Acipenser oxyrinchus oxyrinchus]